MSRKLNDIEEFYVLQHLHLDDEELAEMLGPGIEPETIAIYRHSAPIQEECYSVNFSLYLNRGYEVSIETPTNVTSEEIEANLAAMLNVINTGQLRDRLTFHIMNSFGDGEESIDFALNLINRWMAMEQAQYQTDEEPPVVPPHQVLNRPDAQ
jgi:hypothetical protein